MTTGVITKEDEMLKMYRDMLLERDMDIQLLAGHIDLRKLDDEFRKQYKHPLWQKFKRLMKYLRNESFGALDPNYEHWSFRESEEWYRKYTERRIQNYERARSQLQKILSDVQAPGAYRTEEPLQRVPRRPV